jgi:bifunctional non-homologous end joining protein LigD
MQTKITRPRRHRPADKTNTASPSSSVTIGVFDLIELEGEDLRRKPIEDRKHKLSRLVRTPRPGIVINEHYDGHGDEHACKLGCEGIVSKRLGSPYHSGRSPHWVKVKNPKAPAVKREAEGDWGR